MRRTALPLATLFAVIGLAVAGCGGEEEASPSPQTVSGTTSPSNTTTTTTTTSPTTTTTTGPSATTTTTTTPAPSGNPTAGKAIFTGTAACAGCHTLADAGSTGNVGPNLDQVKPTFDRVVTQVTNGGAAMPAFKGTLTPQQISDVAAYVSSVAGK
jgi:mono/diheme cytochrome c family protein